MKKIFNNIEKPNFKKLISALFVVLLSISLVVTSYNSILSNENIVNAEALDENEKEISDNVEALNSTDSESIYVIQNADGSVKKKILSKTVDDKNTQEEIDTKIPVTQEITFKLDGKEISANDIAGKSGKVEIKFNYQNISANQNGAFVPFVALTGMIIDHDKFHNLEISSGKIINDSDKYIVAGIALPGVRDYLGLTSDVININDSFTLKADVKKFELATTMSLITNDFFNDIDTSKVSSVSDLISDMTKLSDGMNALIDGSKKLSNGVNELNNGGNQLKAGTSKLYNGASSLYDGATKLDAGIDSLASSLTTAKAGAANIVQGINIAQDSIKSSIQDNMEAFAQLASLSDEQKQMLDQCVDAITGGINFSILSQGASSLEAGLGQAVGALTYSGQNQTLKDASSQIKAGLGDNQGEDLKSGLLTLQGGVTAATSGFDALKTGADTLHNGLIKFNDEGIKKLNELTTGEISDMASKLNSMIESSKKYVSYTNKKATTGSVKFIFRTDGIKLKK